MFNVVAYKYSLIVIIAEDENKFILVWVFDVTFPAFRYILFPCNICVPVVPPMVNPVPDVFVNKFIAVCAD